MGAGLLKYQLEVMFLLQRTREMRQFGIEPLSFEQRLEAVRRLDQGSAERLRRMLEGISAEALVQVRDHEDLLRLMNMLVLVRDHNVLLKRVGCTINRQRLSHLHSVVNSLDASHTTLGALLSRGSVVDHPDDPSIWPTELNAIDNLLGSADTLVRNLPLIDWQIFDQLQTSLEASVHKLDDLHRNEVITMKARLNALRTANVKAIHDAQGELTAERRRQQLSFVG